VGDDGDQDSGKRATGDMKEAAKCIDLMTHAVGIRICTQIISGSKRTIYIGRFIHA